jgi:signal transduction histidine kinase/ligand-binding sensor domain-containing protein
LALLLSRRETKPRLLLKSLNTCLEAMAELRRPHCWFLTCLAVVWTASTAPAREPSKAMSQYLRDHWGSEKGFLGGPIYAITQTTDGYLWIGGEKGLTRFDGLNFVLLQNPNAAGGAIGPVLGLTADGEGNLWVRLQSAGLLRYRDGKFEDVSAGFEKHEIAITAMCRGKGGGAVFSSLINGILSYSGGRLSRLVWTPPLPNFLVISMAEMQDGKIWLGTRDTGVFELSGEKVSPALAELRDRKVNCLLPTDGQELWIGTDNGVVRWNGTALSEKFSPASLSGTQILAMVKDHESSVWFGTAQGLFRLGADGGSHMAERDDRLTSAVTALFEDREGNLWTGGAQGLDRLRNSAFTTFSVSEGLPSESNGPLYVDTEGRTWFAPSDGGLYWMAGGKIRHLGEAGLGSDVVYSIAGGKHGLWIGRQRGGLTHFTYTDGGMAPETYTQAQGLPQNSVYAVHQNRDGTVWAGTLSGGVSRLRDGRFATFTAASGLLSNTVTSIEEGANGVMWFGTPKGVNGLSNDRWFSYTTKDGLPSNDVNCLLQDTMGVLWIGTASGLAAIRSGGVWELEAVPESLREPIFGIEEDRDGSLWIATSNHVLRVDRNNLLNGTLRDADVREFGVPDGLRGIEGVKRSRSVVTDQFGRIWFSVNHGIASVDPTVLSRRSLPAIVHIDGISADGNPIKLQEAMRIPAGHRRVTFRFEGLSLSVPERVRFKYKLDGFDQNWSEPVTNREVTYTNLGSGSYQFRIIASNSDGLWNSSESVLPFEVEPAYWQTWWFRLSGVLMIGSAILIFFRLRVLRLTRQMNIRFEERLAERTRIAQELHDTLLQGFLSASMQLHVADDHLAGDSPAKPFVGRALQLMGRVIDEGRNAVRGLRVADRAPEALEKAFSEIQQELAAARGTDFHVFATGGARPLRPMIREEVYWIGREALANAFRHSRASNVEVELEYVPSRLRLLVRDNGSGIDPDVVRVGRDGHWGLSGMRERAERIGARFRVLSAASAGTEIELSVPGHIAFQSPPSHGRWGWLSKLRLRMGQEEHPKPESKKSK